MFINQIFIWADSDYEFVLGFIVPDKDYLLAKLNHPSDIDYKTFICTIPEV